MLHGIVASGQLALINAAPNVGKTLSTLALLIESIGRGNIDGDGLFYINADDNAEGLAVKVAIAEQLGFHMLAEGHSGFQASDILGIIDDVIAEGRASGTILVLDTGKRFTDVMDKRASSVFTGKLRAFVLAGGTAIILSHVNKRPAANGKPIEAGVSDLKDDADCQYYLEEVLVTPDGLRKVIKFERGKSRGYGDREAFFEYSLDPTLPYPAILASFCRLEPEDLHDLERASSFAEDESIIDAIHYELSRRPMLKMELLKAVMGATRAPRREIEAVLDRYTGSDPKRHRWSFVVKDRGGKLYSLIDDGLTY